MKNKNIAAAGSEPAAGSATETTPEFHTTQPYRRGKKAGKRACWKYTAASAGKTQRLAYYRNELYTSQPYRRGKKAGKRASWKYTAANAGKTRRLAYYRNELYNSQPYRRGKKAGKSQA